jgi:YgiT-type zinc finger domain-containing protein
MYGYRCEYCNGIVEERIVTEDFRYKDELVILHNVPVGVCNRCKTRYYNAKVLKQLEKIAKEKDKLRTISVPVGEFQWSKEVVASDSSDALRPL